jgi:OPA family glycerol-3-phosphate transporter-like MFS transporter
VLSLLKPAPAIPPLPADRIDPEYRRLRWQVFAGIFIGYAAFYLVRKNFALAMPDILKEHPQYSKAALGSAMTGLSVAYGVSKFIMGSVSDRSNPRWFMTLGLLLTAGVTFAFGTSPRSTVRSPPSSCCRHSTAGSTAWAGRRAARRWCTGGAPRSAA